MQEISERARNDDSAEVLLKMKMGRVGRLRMGERERMGIDRGVTHPINSLLILHVSLRAKMKPTHVGK